MFHKHLETCIPTLRQKNITIGRRACNTYRYNHTLEYTRKCIQTDTNQTTHPFANQTQTCPPTHTHKHILHTNSYYTYTYTSLPKQTNPTYTYHSLYTQTRAAPPWPKFQAGQSGAKVGQQTGRPIYAFQRSPPRRRPKRGKRGTGSRREGVGTGGREWEG